MAVPRHPDWKQNTPREQLIALLSSCEGELLMQKVTPKQQRAINKLRQAQSILVNMLDDKWEGE